MDAKEVAKIFTHISVTRRECEVQVDQSEFYERKEINKKKQLILEGKDPELQEKIIKKLKEERQKKFKKKTKRLKDGKSENAAVPSTSAR